MQNSKVSSQSLWAHFQSCLTYAEDRAVHLKTTDISKFEFVVTHLPEHVTDCELESFLHDSDPSSNFRITRHSNDKSQAKIEFFSGDEKLKA